jgi:lipopolysaccharide transport system permease protein
MHSAAEELTEAKLSFEKRPRAGGEPAPVNVPVTIIEKRPGWRLVDWRELWRYRELLFFLTWRDVKVRYKQTVLGAAWAVLQPLAGMAVFSLFLGPLAGDAAISVPYPLFVFAGLLIWTLFANALTSASQSVVGSQTLVTKVYFPRLIIPLAAIGANLVDFVIALGMLLILMLGYGVMPGWSILLAPLLVVGVVAASVGIGTLLAALTVRYRDFRHIIPVMVQVWMFATPCIYLPPEKYNTTRFHALLPLNPVFGLVSGFRSAVFGDPLDTQALALSCGVSAIFLVMGLFYFRRVERGFADII